MTYTTENTLDKRRKRVWDALAIKEPDRVSFAPKMSMTYTQAGNISMYEAMSDFRNMDLNTGHQLVDLAFMEEHEYDDFIARSFSFHYDQSLPKKT